MVPVQLYFSIPEVNTLATYVRISGSNILIASQVYTLDELWSFRECIRMEVKEGQSAATTGKKLTGKQIIPCT